MGSSLSTLRGLFEDQAAISATSGSTNPTSTLVNTYINNAIRKIARLDRPREFQNSSPVTANITANANTISIPSGILVPETIYANYSGNSYKHIIYKDLKAMIDLRGDSVFFSTSNIGYPDFYCVRGTSFVFDRYFKTTVSSGLKIYGITPPTTLSSDTDTTSLPIDYDMLITYEALSLFYQKENEDGVSGDNLIKFRTLAQQERSELKLMLHPDNAQVVEMDPNIFVPLRANLSDSGVFFGS